ncbi:MAG: hypothetical protein QXL24_04360 [Candidatus Jordarchaeaceae archaeon]
MGKGNLCQLTGPQLAQEGLDLELRSKFTEQAQACFERVAAYFTTNLEKNGLVYMAGKPSGEQYDKPPPFLEVWERLLLKPQDVWVVYMLFSRKLPYAVEKEEGVQHPVEVKGESVPATRKVPLKPRLLVVERVWNPPEQRVFLSGFPREQHSQLVGVMQFFLKRERNFGTTTVVVNRKGEPVARSTEPFAKKGGGEGSDPFSGIDPHYIRSWIGVLKMVEDIFKKGSGKPECEHRIVVWRTWKDVALSVLQMG